MVILINYSTANELYLYPEYVEEVYSDKWDGYTSVKFRDTGDYSELISISVRNQLLDNNAAYLLIDDISRRALNLQTLSLGSNKISGDFDLGRLQQIKNLSAFFINSNDITNLVYSATEDMPKMTHLSLAGNEINYIDFDVFERFPNLIQILLHFNKLAGTIDLGRV